MGSGTWGGGDGEALAAVWVDVRYALGQLRNFGDTGRAVDALDRADELLTALCGLWEADGPAHPATPEDAGTRFPAGPGVFG